MTDLKRRLGRIEADRRAAWSPTDVLTDVDIAEVVAEIADELDVPVADVAEAARAMTGRPVMVPVARPRTPAGGTRR